MQFSLLRLHTVDIWTFTFHKKIRLCKGDSTSPSLLWAGNSNILHLFFFYFLQSLSNPLPFTNCCCYSKELTYLNCNFCINSSKNRRKMSIIGLNFQPKKGWIWPVGWIEICLQNTLTKPDFLWNVNVQIAIVWVCNTNCYYK